MVPRSAHRKLRNRYNVNLTPAYMASLIAGASQFRRRWCTVDVMGDAQTDEVPIASQVLVKH